MFFYKGVLKIRKTTALWENISQETCVVLSQSSEAKADPTHDQKMGHIWLSRPQKGSKFGLAWSGFILPH